MQQGMRSPQNSDGGGSMRGPGSPMGGFSPPQTEALQNIGEGRLLLPILPTSPEISGNYSGCDGRPEAPIPGYAGYMPGLYANA